MVLFTRVSEMVLRHERATNHRATTNHLPHPKTDNMKDNKIEVCCEICHNPINPPQYQWMGNEYYSEKICNDCKENNFFHLIEKQPTITPVE